MTTEPNFLKIHSIESFGTHDGPGIRLVVFLQGCNLKCLYCQNADTITKEGGQLIAPEEIVRRAQNMRAYFGKTGGVTFSGGEPLLQSKKLIPLIQQLQQEGIHVNIDTNGTVGTDTAREIIGDLADLIMFDMKHTNAAGFENLTGVKGLNKAVEMIKLRESSQKPFWLRYVLVPGYTDDDSHFQWLIDHFSTFKQLELLEIIPYHKLGKYKWEALGETYQLEDVPENTAEQIQHAVDYLTPWFKKVSAK